MRQGIDAQVQALGPVQSGHVVPKALTQLGLEGRHQPFGQIVPMPIEQGLAVHRIALLEPLFLGLAEGTVQKIPGALAWLRAVGQLVLVMGKPQDGHAPLFGAAA